jgi:lipooligosaccharide transport system ATP-binding protein
MLLTTHYLEEASQLCDRLIVLNHGNILVEGTPAQLILDHVGSFALEIGAAPASHPQILAWCSGCLKTSQRIGNDLILYADDGQELAESLAVQVDKEHLQVSYQRLRPTNLEDVFLKLTGETLLSSGSEAAENNGGFYG